MSHRVYLSIGSNIDRELNIRSAVEELAKLYGELVISPVYESESVGFQGAPFYNFVVAINTEDNLKAIVQSLKNIEDQHGRVRQGPKFSSRTLDIDVVTFDEVVGELDGIDLPRAELFYNAFVLLPMVDLLGSAIEPKTGQPYDTLVDLLPNEQKIRKIEFSFS